MLAQRVYTEWTSVLHMKRLNQTESPIFVIFFFFSRGNSFLLLFYLSYLARSISSRRGVYVVLPCLIKVHIQSPHVITTSLISNDRLSRSEILVPVLTRKSKNNLRTDKKKGEIAPK